MFLLIAIGLMLLLIVWLRDQIKSHGNNGALEQVPNQEDMNRSMEMSSLSKIGKSIDLEENEDHEHFGHSRDLEQSSSNISIEDDHNKDSLDNSELEIGRLTLE